jgi:translocation and assembly module TamB
MSHTMVDPEPKKPVKEKGRNRLLWKIAAWTAGSVVALFLFAVITLSILLHSERFHNYVLRTVRAKASDSLGVRVQVQNFALNLWHLDLDLYGVTVDGAAPYAAPALLQVDHAEASVRILSILHGKWYLESFRVDRPILRVFVDDHGVSNIPTLKSSGNSSSTSIFDLAIRQAVLDKGEVYYNNRESPLDADLHDVEFQASFNSLLQKYSGKLSYSNGHLVSGSLKTIPHNLEAEFDATPTTFHLTQAKLSTGSSQIALTATLQNYASPVAEARYDATIDGAQVGQIFESASVPTGQIRVTGSLHYQQMANRTLLESLVVNGDLNSRQLNVRTSSIRTQVTNLLAHYSLENGDANLKDLSLNLLGGRLTANGTMSNVGGDSHSKVNAILHGVSLAELRRLGGASSSTQNVAIAGGVNADLAATWGKTLGDLVAHADATVNGTVSGAVNGNGKTAVVRTASSAAPATGVPIQGEIHGI